jgi:chemotaxis protein methyltransferase CheR
MIDFIGQSGAGTALPAKVAREPTAAVPGIADLELHLLLEGIQRVSGFDFRDYSPATIKRRVAERMRAEGAATTTGLLERILHEPAALSRLVDALTRTASSPFREPAFFDAFRQRVLPRLRTFPHARVWVIGSGDDAYALAILLREANFSHRTRIYATDLSGAAVERAKAGTFSAELLDEYSQRYTEAGGTRLFSDYLDLAGSTAAYKAVLREQLVFAQHNLATDGSFNEFHLIVARNVFTHFNRGLAYRAHQIVFESLVRLGYLGLGARESLRYTPHQRVYEPVEASENLYRRVR